MYIVQDKLQDILCNRQDISNQKQNRYTKTQYAAMLYLGFGNFEGRSVKTLKNGILINHQTKNNIY